MKLAHEFYQLPLSFDVERLQQEVLQLDETFWQAHHEGFKGNIAVPLLSVNGSVNNDFKGPIKETQALQQLPYIRQVLASFNQVFGRSRLMALEPGCQVPEHTDINYHWYNRVRIHIPIVTTEQVIFYCADKQVHMGAGECWIFDSWKQHKVVNNSNVRRIHLVIDTHGDSKFWQLVNKSTIPGVQQALVPHKHLPYSVNNTAVIATERFNLPVVLSPGELDFMLGELKREIELANNDTTITANLFAKLDAFAQDWRQLYSLYGQSEAGWERYHQRRDQLFHSARELASQLSLTNHTSALQMLIHCIIDPALNVEVAQNQLDATAPVGGEKSALAKQAKAANDLPRPPSAMVSRNSLCHCESGKKFKHCCGAL
ncbi:aspartyl/asparaginyl beta-hydroxylase domain-containing protein [Thalassotalea ponticola]|uniref:aspartyl/asparaginyl beta-hydroxylase domain-containing protein n=1 Tax=Thalassotalea ponticola TaxID=1523392 RepID=UPI0025B4B7C3|nr:aspartyl/asparaginyl beta-hydroxylase domain-containing protein [Thalassotalea ponticola]MDN3653151.1 aspartyl/asparaginyl beta-hydroxylase domain-containing protein [Thalassotalea ponticola]